MIKFANIEYFWFLLIALLFIVLYFLYNSWIKSSINKFGNKKQLEGLMPGISNLKPVYKITLLILGLIFIVIGLADRSTAS